MDFERESFADDTQRGLQNQDSAQKGLLFGDSQKGMLLPSIELEDHDKQ